MTTTIYNAADVAELLRVTRAAVVNYRTRYTDTPAPDYATPSGNAYWSVDGMKKWLAWHERLTSGRRPGGRDVKTDARIAAIEKLRAELA
jgi:polygalacturonase